MRFRGDPAGIRGSIAPLVTPFLDSGELDLKGLEELIDWQIAAGSHGISLGGSTGEPASQSVAERIQAIRTAAQVVADRVPFVPGTGSARLDETLEMTDAAAEAGADAVLVITPYYTRPTQEGLYRWYEAVATTFPDLPVIAYNVPTRTAVDLAPETVGRLRASFPNLVGVKETTKDFEHFSRVFYACGRDVLVWSGIELLCLPLLALGGSGFVSAVANLAPGPLAAMYDRWTEGDHAGALALHDALHPLADLVFVETNPAPVKWVLETTGRLASSHVRPPLVPLTKPGQEKVEILLAEAGDLVGFSPRRP